MNSTIYFKIPLFLFYFLLQSLTAQDCYNLNIQLQAELPSTCFEITMTMLHDQNDKPYLYVASKEGGLKIYDISNIFSPSLVKTIETSSLGNLHAMNLTQSGNYIFLALGNHFNNSQSPGMAIVDVNNPLSASVVSVWKFTRNDGGCGIVKVQDNYAYLGAMNHGLIILDISDKQNPKQVSQFEPDKNFPDKKHNKKKINARGMAVYGNIVYLCYDAGGFRTINVTDKTKPFEEGRYSNPELNGKPRAYNNVIIEGSYAYVTVDYCGLEALNVSNPKSITLASWWNPYDCQKNPLSWFSSPGHMNEIDINKECGLLFISSGKSDLHVLNISTPGKIDSCSYYGGVSNNIGTWGVNVYKNQVYLSYVCSLIPFASNWTGVKILSYSDCVK